MKKTALMIMIGCFAACPCQRQSIGRWDGQLDQARLYLGVSAAWAKLNPRPCVWRRSKTVGSCQQSSYHCRFVRQLVIELCRYPEPKVKVKMALNAYGSLFSHIVVKVANQRRGWYVWWRKPPDKEQIEKDARQVASELYRWLRALGCRVSEFDA